VNRSVRYFVGAASLVLAASTQAVVISGSDGPRAASVEFLTSGTQLHVYLKNTATSGAPMPLTRVSALLGPGSVVTNGTTPGDGVVGGEWASGYKASGYPGGLHYGISSSGLGDFGSGDGIPSAGDAPPTHNGGANTPLIQSEVRFVLDGLPANFDLASITAVRFVYGTAYGEGQFDVPAPAGALTLGLAGLAVSRRRRA